MKLRLSDVLDNLLIGEFSQLSWAEGDTFSNKNINKIIVLLNAGLTDISSRFWVKRKDVYVTTKAGCDVYTLDQAVAGGMGFSLCHRNGDKFEDDLMEIYSITDEAGNPFWINRDVDSDDGYETNQRFRATTPGALDAMDHGCRDARFSATVDKANTITTIHQPFGTSNIRPLHHGVINLLAYNKFRVPKDLKPCKLKVTYRASAARMRRIEDYVGKTPDQIFVDVPPAYLSALLNYIASRKFNPNLNGVQQGFHEGNNYYQKYLSACALLQDQGFEVEPMGNEGSKFTSKGFV